MIEISRRKFLIGSALTVFAAPAIVRAASLMPVKEYRQYEYWISGFDEVGYPLSEYLTYRGVASLRGWSVVRSAGMCPGNGLRI